MVANEGQARFDSPFFADCHDPVRIGEVGDLRAHAGADPGDMSLRGRAAERDRADR